MFKRLQRKWGVSTRQFWVIFIAFGLTGTTAAILTRYITGWLGFDASTHWAWKLLLRLAMLLIGYQILLLFYGALLGEWAFFWRYERRLLEKLGMLKKSHHAPGVTESKNQKEDAKLFIHDSHDINRHSVIRIAIFASGAGSNAEKIIHYLKDHASIEVSLVVCNNPDAGVLNIAKANSVPVLLIDKEKFFRGDAYVPELKQHRIDFIVLAGFLWKVPVALINSFPRKIINIHPALLPKHGGKGMYGMKVHEMVISSKEKESGITIHYVNERFDEGEHIFQARCPIDEADTPESLAAKIHALEHEHFPVVVEKLLMRKY